MHKPAPADHPINDVLRTRWSPREILRSLFEAARWAPCPVPKVINSRKRAPLCML